MNSLSKWQQGLGMAFKYSALLIYFFHMEVSSMLQFIPILLLVERLLMLHEKSFDIFEKYLSRE